MNRVKVVSRKYEDQKSEIDKLREANRKVREERKRRARSSD